MSEFIISSLRDTIFQLERADDTKEIRSIKTLAHILIDRVSKDTSNREVEDALIETISNDIEALKRKGNVLSDYRFWGIISSIIIGLCTAFWGLAMLKIKEDLTSVFASKRFEALIEKNVSDLNKYNLNDSNVVRENKASIQEIARKYEELDKRVTEAKNRDEIIHNQIWSGLKEVQK